MDPYRMNYRNSSGTCRNRPCSCNMAVARETEPMMTGNRTCEKEHCHCEEKSIQEHLKGLPLAMAYVPMQKFGTVFDAARGFQKGTIFPELCKPFCGNGGGCRR